jgi:transcription antitermination factor NusG
MTGDAASTVVDRLPCYALRVRPRHEKSVAEALRLKGYEEFLPLCEQRRRWDHTNSRTIRTVRLPLFPSYVFCRFDPQRLLPIVQTPGVRSVVSFTRRPAPLDEEEVAALRRIVDSGLPAAPHPDLRVGSYVRIRGGPLSGLEGFLEVDKGRHRLVVGVSLLQRAVSVEVESSWVAPAAPPAIARAASAWTASRLSRSA